MIGIIDYQMGNLASLTNSLGYLGFDAKVIQHADQVRTADRLILPGVGAFGDACDHLQKSGMDAAIREFVQSGKWLFGICLGLQLLFETSEESAGAAGLGLLKGSVQKFDQDMAAYPIKIPHMGWNYLNFTRDHALFNGVQNRERLYFVHSFYAVCSPLITVATSSYGYDFACAVAHENIAALQPHPEKSHSVGLKILQNFAEL